MHRLHFAERRVDRWVRAASCAVLALCLVSGIAPTAAPTVTTEREDPAPFVPTRKYEVREVRGWKVRIGPALLKQRKLFDAAWELLDHQLYQIVRAVPEKAVKRLRKVPIWLELEDPQGRHPCAVYHPSANWLRSHGFNPDKAGAVEIANATNFLDWSHHQSWMVLHELAHAWHWLELEGDDEIKAAYERAKTSGKYDKVLNRSGGTRRHYALENEREWFAEMTEAHFGVNDMFPFVRVEAEKFDPRGMAVVRRAWGVK